MHKSLTITTGDSSLTAIESNGGLFLPNFTLTSFVLFLAAYAGTALVATVDAIVDNTVTPVEPEQPTAQSRAEGRSAGRRGRRRAAATMTSTVDPRTRARKNLDLTEKDLDRIRSAVSGDNGAGITLSHMQKNVLGLRYPLNGEPHTLHQIASQLRVSPGRVRQELRTGMSKLGVRYKATRGRPPRINNVDTTALNGRSAEEVLAETR